MQLRSEAKFKIEYFAGGCTLNSTLCGSYRWEYMPEVAFEILFVGAIKKYALLQDPE